MRHEAFWLTASDSTEFHVNHWSPTQEPQAIVMLVHGMAEHSKRYAHLGAALAKAGIALYALDLRGHGFTASFGVKGYFGNHNGWQLVLDDIRCLNHHIRQQHHEKPVFIFGHSLGSYLVIDYLLQYCCSVQGVILSGSNYIQSTFRYKLALQVARFERWRLGKQGRSKLLHWLIFNRLQRAFKPQKTPHDWLSSDENQVKLYAQDPLCGFISTTQLWIDALTGLQRITPISNLVQIDNLLPILIFGGEHDPIHQGHRLIDLANAFRESGNRFVDVKLYSDMRHEPLNEKNSPRVIQDIIDWIKHNARLD